MTTSTVSVRHMAEPRIATRLKRAANHAAHWRSERDELIVKAHEAGASYREIAQLVGLSHVGVRRIVNAAT